MKQTITLKLNCNIYDAKTCLTVKTKNKQPPYLAHDWSFEVEFCWGDSRVRKHRHHVGKEAEIKNKHTCV